MNVYVRGKNMKALLIEWDPNTGVRAGNINPRDPKLQCYGWQNMDLTPAVELRIIEDDRDVSQYESVQGVTVINGKSEINQAIDNNFPPQYAINDRFLYEQHFNQKNKKVGTEIDIDSLSDDPQERLKTLKETHKVKGITKRERQKV